MSTADRGETYLGNVRQEFRVGNGCGGKPGSYGSKVISLSRT